MTKTDGIRQIRKDGSLDWVQKHRPWVGSRVAESPLRVHGVLGASQAITRYEGKFSGGSGLLSSRSEPLTECNENTVQLEAKFASPGV